MTMSVVASQAPVKGIVKKANWLFSQMYGGPQGGGTVKRGGIISNALTGITPRANPAEKTGMSDEIGPRRRRPLGPPGRRRGYGRGLGGPVRNVLNPVP